MMISFWRAASKTSRVLPFRWIIRDGVCARVVGSKKHSGCYDLSCKKFGALARKKIYLVVAIDNDRAPEHPFHQQLPGLNATEQRMNCRFCELLQIIEDALGKDRSQWPIRGAIAVPVQMLESWLLLSCGHLADSLPLFASKAQPIAARYYAPRQPTDQLKDLCTLERQKAANLSMAEFCLICAHSLNPETLAEQSPSFANFKTQVDSWM